MLILAFNRNNLIKLNRSLSDRFEKDLELPENRPHLLAYSHWFHRFFRLHYFYTGAIVLLMIITPLLALRHGKYVRAYPQLLPYDYQKGKFQFYKHLKVFSCTVLFSQIERINSSFKVVLLIGALTHSN